MTILWDADPAALDSYRYALGADVELIQSGPRVSRVLAENPAHTLVVIGPEWSTSKTPASWRTWSGSSAPRSGSSCSGTGSRWPCSAAPCVAGSVRWSRPTTGPALADAVRRSRALTAQLHGHQSGADTRDAKVITVFSAKGGVGKTTLSTNIASYLASMHARTLLIDLDLMFGDVAISLQLVPTSSIRDLVAMGGHLDREGLASVAHDRRHQWPARARRAGGPRRGGTDPGRAHR